MINVSKQDRKYIEEFLKGDNLHKHRYELSYLHDAYSKFETVKNFTSYFTFISQDVLSYGIYHLWKNNEEITFLNALYTSARLDFLKNVSIANQVKQSGYYGNYVNGLMYAMVLNDNDLLSKYFERYPRTDECKSKHIRIMLNYIYFRNNQYFNPKQYEDDILHLPLLKSNKRWETAYYSCLKGLYQHDKDLFVNSLQDYQKLYLSLSHNKYNVTLSKYFSWVITFFIKEGLILFNNEVTELEKTLYYCTGLTRVDQKISYELLISSSMNARLIELLNNLPIECDFSSIERRLQVN